MNLSGTSRGVYFLIPEFLQLVPRIPLVPVILGFNKPLLKKLMHTPHFSATIELFSSALKLLINPSVLIEGLPPGMLMNIL